MNGKPISRVPCWRRDAAAVFLLAGVLAGCGPTQSPPPQVKKPQVRGGRMIEPVAQQPAAPAETPPNPTPPPSASPQPQPAPPPPTPDTSAPVASAPTPQNTAVIPTIAKDADGFYLVTFKVLSAFNFKPSIDLFADAGQGDPAGHNPAAGPARPRDKLAPTSNVPDAIQKLNKEKVRVEGFMVPVDYEDGGSNEFYVMANIPGCWYCEQPKLNDWIEVKMKDAKRTPYVPEEPIVVYGVLEVGEEIKDGFVTSLYRMEGLRAQKLKLQ